MAQGEQYGIPSGSNFLSLCVDNTGWRTACQLRYSPVLVGMCVSEAISLAVADQFDDYVRTGIAFTGHECPSGGSTNFGVEQEWYWCGPSTHLF